MHTLMYNTFLNKATGSCLPGIVDAQMLPQQHARQSSGLQYTQRLRQEAERLRRECNALLRERFGLEQCIR